MLFPGKHSTSLFYKVWNFAKPYDFVSIPTIYFHRNEWYMHALISCHIHIGYRIGGLGVYNYLFPNMYITILLVKMSINPFVASHSDGHATLCQKCVFQINYSSYTHKTIYANVPNKLRRGVRNKLEILSAVAEMFSWNLEILKSEILLWKICWIL